MCENLSLGIEGLIFYEEDAWQVSFAGHSLLYGAVAWRGGRIWASIDIMSATICCLPSLAGLEERTPPATYNEERRKKLDNA